MKKATKEMIEEWKKTFKKYRPSLEPNRHTVMEVIEYLEKNYALKPILSEEAKKVVMDNVMMNQPYLEKIPKGEKLEPVTFEIERNEKSENLYEIRDSVYKDFPIFVGLEKVTGCVFVEGSDELADEITAFQGLDEMDLNNYYLVANYVRCLKKFNL